MQSGHAEQARYLYISAQEQIAMTCPAQVKPVWSDQMPFPAPTLVIVKALEFDSSGRSAKVGS